MPGLEAAQAVAVLLRLAKHVGHLPLERVEALVEAHHRRLGRGRVVGEAGGVGRLALWEDAPLHLVDLALEAIDALLGRRLLALSERGERRQQDAPRRGR